MKEKLIALWIKLKNKLKSPVVWGGAIAIVGLVFTTAGYSLTDVSTWPALGGVILAILASPEKLALIIAALFALLNNPDKHNEF